MYIGHSKDLCQIACFISFIVNFLCMHNFIYLLYLLEHTCKPRNLFWFIPPLEIQYETRLVFIQDKDLSCLQPCRKWPYKLHDLILGGGWEKIYRMLTFLYNVHVDAIIWVTDHSHEWLARPLWDIKCKIQYCYIFIIGTLQTTSNSGLQMITDAFRARGIILQCARILECLQRIDPVNTSLQRLTTTFRRTYYVPGPNALWWGYELKALCQAGMHPHSKKHCVGVENDL